MDRGEGTAEELPVRFPTEGEKLRDEVREYSGASPGERVRAALELSSLVESILLGTPTRERQIRLLEAEEERENATWRELISRYVRGTDAQRAC